jgi:hypothetical protein
LSFIKKLLIFLKQLENRRPLFRVLLQTVVYELPEFRRPILVLRELGRRRVKNNEKHSHSRQLRIRSFSSRQLNGSDAQGPNVRLEVVAITLLHHLRSHPAGRANKSLPFVTNLYVSTDSEIAQEDVSITVEQNVASLNVSMDLAL